MFKNLNRDFLIFASGQLISTLGLRIGQMGFSWWVLQWKNPGLLSFLLAITFVVNLIVTPLLGPIGDTFSRKKCAFISDITGCIILFLFFVFVCIDFFNIFIVVFLLNLLTIASALLTTVVPALIPMLANKYQLQSAIEFNNLIHSFNKVLGVTIGGFLLGIINLKNIFLLNSIAVLTAALCTLAIRKDISIEVNQSFFRYVLEKWWFDFHSGLRLIVKLPLEIWWNLFAMLINFILIPFVMVVIPTVAQQYQPQLSWSLGLLWGSFSLGSMSGSILTRFLNKIFAKDLVTVGGMVFMSLGISVFGLNMGIIYLSVCVYFVGFGLMMHNINSSFIRTLATPDIFRSRLMACSKVLSNIFIPLGFLVTGIVIKTHLLFSYLIVTGLISAILLPFLLLIPNFITLMRSTIEEAENFYEKRYPQLFIC